MIRQDVLSSIWVGGLIDYKSFSGLIIAGSIPSAGTNKVGDISAVSYSCYGYYNNVNDSSGEYAPAYSFGMFLRIYHKARKVILYLTSDNHIWSKEDSGSIYKII